MILTPKLLPLLNAMQSLQGILPAKAIRQCTRHFHFAIAERQLAVSASDIEMTARIMVPCAAKSASPILVPPSLIPLLKGREAEEFDINVEKNVATIRFGFDEFEIPLCAEVAEWPEPRNADEITGRCTVNANVFGLAVKRATMAASQEASRYGLNGVALRMNGKRLDVVATDSKQMLLTKLHTTKTSGDMASYKNVMPIKCANVLAGLCEGFAGADDIEIGVGNGGIFAAREGFAFTSLLIEGSAFPMYERVLDSQTDKEALIPSESFEKAIEVGSHFTGDETKAFSLEFDEGKLTLKAAEATKGRGTQTIACDYQGEPIEIRAGIEYLRNAIKVSGEHVRLSMCSADKIVLSGEGDVTFGFMPRNK